MQTASKRLVLPDQGCVLGIDVGWSKRKRSSAICRLDWSSTSIRWDILRFHADEVERRSALSRMTRNVSPLAAALDGPIIGNLEAIGRYRAAERMLTVGLQRHIGKPGQANAPVGRLLNHHTNECARILLKCSDIAPASHRVAIHPKGIVEAFPTSFMGLMLGNAEYVQAIRSNRSDVFFKELERSKAFEKLINYFIPKRAIKSAVESITNHDDRAAFVCALTALCVAARDFVAVGDDDGWIILPPRCFIQERYWQVLTDNAQKHSAGALHIEIL